MRQHFRAIIGSVLFFSLYIYATSADNIRRPIALDKISSGDLYALDMSGTVFRITVSNGVLAVVGSFNLPTFFYPSDLVSAKLFGQPTLFVTANTQQFGFVSQYSLTGKAQHSWTFNYGMAGLDVDFNSHIIYVASSDRPEIYQINLQPVQYTNPVFAGEVLGASRLGPLVCDVGKRKLFLGDIEAGKIFEFDIQTHKSRVVAARFASPQGLLLSADTGLLYVADASRRKIYVLDLAHANTVPRVFSAIAEFRSPSGLARLEDGRILVADDHAGAIFVLSKNGTLQSTLHR